MSFYFGYEEAVCCFIAQITSASRTCPTFFLPSWQTCHVNHLVCPRFQEQLNLTCRKTWQMTSQSCRSSNAFCLDLYHPIQADVLLPQWFTVSPNERWPADPQKHNLTPSQLLWMEVCDAGSSLCRNEHAPAILISVILNPELISDWQPHARLHLEKHFVLVKPRNFAAGTRQVH